MNPLGSRRKAEAFAAVVDGRARSTDAELTALAAVVDRVRVEGADPSPAFRHGLREQLMTAAVTELRAAGRTPAASPARTAATQPVRTRLGRRFGALAGAAVVAGSSISLVAASADTLPGDLLYPVKRAGEGVDLMIRTDSATEGTVQLQHATTRLAEVDALTRSVDAGSTQHTALVSATLRDFTEQATDGAADLITAFELEQETGAIDELNGFTTDAARQLQELAGVVPTGSGHELEGAADAVIDLAARTAAACQSCAPVDDEDLTALLQSVDAVLAAMELPPAAEASAPLVAPEDDTGTVAEGRSTARWTTAPDVKRPEPEGDGRRVTTPEPERPGRGLTPPADGGDPADGPVHQRPPVDENPVDENPVDENPVDENPVDENPVDESPVDNGPVDNGPVDNGPVVPDVPDVPDVPVETTAPDLPPTDPPVVVGPLPGQGSSDQGDAGGGPAGPTDALPGGGTLP